MNGQSAMVALGLIAAPAAAALAGRSSENDTEEVRCVAKGGTPVESHFGGETVIPVILSRGSPVTVFGSTGQVKHVKYRFENRVRTGWIAEHALEECGASTAEQPATPTPRAAAHSTSATDSFHPHGTPKGAFAGTLLKKAKYDCFHDPELKYCRWVGYCYEPTDATLPRYSGDFFPEPTLAKGERAERDDYVGAYKKNLTGFDRGHMAPDGALKAFGRSAQRETYSLANITPQYSRTNQGIWRELEDRIRQWATASEPICVETGPVFFDDRPVKHLTGPNHLAIPHAHYAIVSQGSEPDVISFIVPNEPERRSISEVMEFAESVDAIENVVKPDFLADLPDDMENQIESAVPERLW